MNLENLKNYSIKYYEIIKNIKDDPDKCQFIYNKFITIEYKDI